MSKEDDIVFLPCPSTSLLSQADELEKTTPATRNLLFFPRKQTSDAMPVVWSTLSLAEVLDQSLSL
jgi:hypothetical protein